MTTTVPVMSLGWNEQMYGYVPGAWKVCSVVSPGFTTVFGASASGSWTECVNWSLFVQRDRCAGGNRDGRRREAVRARHVDPIGRHGRARTGLCGASSERDGGDESKGRHRVPGRGSGHERLGAAAAFATVWVAATNTRMKASRSRTSLTVWAKRKTVQSRW